MRNRTISWIILVFALLFVGTSVWFTQRLSRQFAEIEKQRMEVWAEATRQLVIADENTDISLYSSIIEANTTIPVYMTDADFHVNHLTLYGSTLWMPCASSSNCSGVSDWRPSQRAWGGSLCTSMISPSAPATVAAMAMDFTR